MKKKALKGIREKEVMRERSGSTGTIDEMIKTEKRGEREERR